MRGRSYSYSPSPPRDYVRRRRSPSPRGRYGGRGGDPPTSLLVRNLRHDCRPEDLRGPFGQFGRLKDIYLPRDYYTGEPRGFGFVQYLDPADAADAKYHMDGYVLLGRELTVVFAEENRKKPSEMRARERGRHIGSPRYNILDHHDILKVMPTVQTITLLCVGKDATRGLFHLEIGDIEGDLTRGHPMAQGVQTRALVGAGAEVWTILGD
ncbi:serine/arginine-rich SC35-like splicing factor SCL33 isoform X2 [Durio zibethinus]|uniref:Serine/arginine-rich SC35-like splicing factor SCL33 isoform X2 n=1 Tax=Durio zibethinus TaxID=66656 RepID=A0A6P6APQ1_DURZI|nr:serine/arginine-rich SC35-like splicing factor SCL33 isoform X2 [Durio zibethinus]XP_022766867.1 serine/arginine-rich SC35-like splicing factor SCL33 isoform X2 [Durio zibethinus]XP_022766868.1 serine/arginine-rich SC35-like splicing factor SCL33 isoform X2 [Durio zibethinus]